MRWMRPLSKIQKIPGLHLFSPAVNSVPNNDVLDSYLKCQQLAVKAAKEVSGLIQEGWTEKQTATLFRTYLQDLGVQSFFHDTYAWFGERTRFRGIRNYAQYMPSSRRIRTNEVFILDVAPIYNGFIADIGYTSCLGENLEWNRAKDFLKTLRNEIPLLFKNAKNGAEIWTTVDKKIADAGYENIHRRYPFSVLGHRVHQVPEFGSNLKILHFGWQSYWSLLSRGLLGQLLTEFLEGDLTGLWAVEPHLGSAHFGAKFEELLVVNKENVYWLDKEGELL